MANGLCDVAKIEQEHYQGTLDEVFQGEGLSPGELCHDIGEREGEVAQVLSERSGSQEGAKLAL